MTIPVLGPHAQAMADREAQALNLLGADHDLGSAALLKFIEYLADSEGIAPPVSPTL